MTKTKNYAIIAAASFMMVCFMAGSGFAYGPPHDGFRGKGDFKGFNCNRGGDFDKFLVDNGVPAETVNAFIADKNKFRAENEAVFEAMRAKGLELYEEMGKAAPDANKAKALQAELSKMRADFDIKRIEHELYIKTTYPKICEVMQQKFQDRDFGPGRGFGPGHDFGPGHGFGPGPQKGLGPQDGPGPQKGPGPQR